MFYSEVWGIQFIYEVAQTNCGPRYRTRCDPYLIAKWEGCADPPNYGGYLCGGYQYCPFDTRDGW